LKKDKLCSDEERYGGAACLVVKGGAACLVVDGKKEK